MKKSIISLAAIIFTAGHFCFASPVAKTDPPVTITLDQTFTGLVVDNNINIVLTNETGNEIILNGAPLQVNKVRAKVKKGSLYLWLPDADKGEKVIVSVPAILLRQIIVNGESSVRTDAILENAGMEVIVNGACKLALRSRGPIGVNGTSDYEFKKK